MEYYRSRWSPNRRKFSFSVNLPAAETPAEEQVETQDETTQTEQEAEKEEVEIFSEEKAEELQENKIPSYVIPTIIGILIVIVIGSFYFMIKRKK